jgi:hypothetical protein
VPRRWHALQHASSSTPGSAATSPPNAVLCADAAALRASLDKLTHVKVGAGTVSEITADLNDVKANLTAFVNHRRPMAGPDQRTEIRPRHTQAAVSNLAANPSTSAVSGVVTALGGVNMAAQNLLAAVNTRCPSVSPSPST